MFLTVIQKPEKEMAAIVKVLEHSGGMSLVVAIVGRGAQALVHQRQTKSMVSFSQSMHGL